MSWKNKKIWTRWIIARGLPVFSHTRRKPSISVTWQFGQEHHCLLAENQGPALWNSPRPKEAFIETTKLYRVQSNAASPQFFPPWWCGSGGAGGLKARLPDAVPHLLPRKASAPPPACAERLGKAKASSARNEATQRNQPPAEAATQDSPSHAL